MSTPDVSLTIANYAKASTSTTGTRPGTDEFATISLTNDDALHELLHLQGITVTTSSTTSDSTERPNAPGLKWSMRGDQIDDNFSTTIQFKYAGDDSDSNSQREPCILPFL